MKERFSMRRIHSTVIVLSLVSLVIFLVSGLSGDLARAASQKKSFTTDFRVDECTFLTTGSNPYFIPLETGAQLTLAGEEGKEEVVVVITVLEDTKEITLDSGTITTRVIEERETIDGELVEVSKNWFAICEETNSVFYFGEWVDNYEDGTIDNHEGSWEAGVDEATPGIMMPGTFLIGSRYFQEIAEDVAMDRGENLAMDLTVWTPAGTFEDCVQILETTPLEPNAKDIKIYASGVGLVVDGPIRLVDYNLP